MGVSLNEEADVEANKGLESREHRQQLRSAVQSLLSPVDGSGSHVNDFQAHIRNRISRSGLDSIRSGGGLTTE
eukprot:2173829-Rhodomonas_salina.1